MKGLSIEPSRAFGRRAAFFRSIRRDIFTHINAGNAETRGVVEMARALIIPGDAQFNLADPLAFQRMLKSPPSLVYPGPVPETPDKYKNRR